MNLLRINPNNPMCETSENLQDQIQREVSISTTADSAFSNALDSMLHSGASSLDASFTDGSNSLDSDCLIEADEGPPAAEVCARDGAWHLWPFWRLITDCVGLRDEVHPSCNHQSGILQQAATQLGVALPTVDPNLRENINWLGRLASIGEFQVEDFLGKGSYGEVYKASLAREAGMSYAVKIMRKRKITDRHAARLIVKEVEYLSKLPEHPHLPKLHKLMHSYDSLYLCLSYGGQETLSMMQRRCPQQRLPLCDAQNIFGQITSAVSHLHAHDVCHRDIKQSNVAMNGMQAMLVDLGMAEDLRESLDAPCGSLPYVPPEALDLHCRYFGDQADAFALGVVLFELVRGYGSFTDALDIDSY